MKNLLKLPCPDKDGKYITIKDCDICYRKNYCDTYITLIEEDNEYEDDSEQ